MDCGVRTCSWLQGATIQPTHTPTKERASCKIPFSPHHTGYSNLFEMFSQFDKVKRISCFKVHSVLFFSFLLLSVKRNVFSSARWSFVFLILQFLFHMLVGHFSYCFTDSCPLLNSLLRINCLLLHV